MRTEADVIAAWAEKTYAVICTASNLSPLRLRGTGAEVCAGVRGGAWLFVIAGARLTVLATLNFMDNHRAALPRARMMDVNYFCRASWSDGRHAAVRLSPTLPQ